MNWGVVLSIVCWNWRTRDIQGACNDKLENDIKSFFVCSWHHSRNILHDNPLSANDNYLFLFARENIAPINWINHLLITNSELKLSSSRSSGGLLWTSPSSGSNFRAERNRNEGSEANNSCVWWRKGAAAWFIHNSMQQYSTTYGYFTFIIEIFLSCFAFCILFVYIFHFYFRLRLILSLSQLARRRQQYERDLRLFDIFVGGH